MAELGEVAIGIASVLGSPWVPQPFPVTLKGYSLVDAALLLPSILRECSDSDIKLSQVEVPTALLRHLRDSHMPDAAYLGVQLIDADHNGTDLLFHRAT